MTLQTINTQSASLTANLTAGSRYVWRVGVPRGDGNLTFSDWSDPFTAVQPADNSIQVGEDIDIGTGKILYSNVYPTLADLPAAANYHGMFAHVHDEGAAYYAHAGNWVRLADDADVPTAFVSGLNGLTGPVILAAGSNVQIGQSGNQLTISSTQTFSTLNGESGTLSLVGSDGIAVSTVDGTITVSGAGLATESFVNQAVADLVNSAPQALDTLAELANALNNDSDFAANVTTLISQKADANHDHVKANITDLTTADLDMQGNRVLFANYYATQGDFPDPATYHGMVAHSHADGAFYGAHAGAWVRLANQNEIPAATSVNTLTGNVTLVAGDNINVTTSGQNVVISGEQGGIVWSTPPQSGSSPGSPGDIAYDNNFLYLRTSQAWRQVALSPISTNITISQQPTNQSVGDGDTATFTVLATAGGEAITYQWEQSADNGSTFVDISGATSNSLTVTANLSLDGYQYRASLSAPGAADVTTSVATLTVAETFDLLAENGDRLMTEGGDSIDHDGIGPTLTITAQPQNTTASGGEASFTVSATVSDGSALTYQWEEERLANDGATWVQRTLPATARWESVTYGDGTFVAVTGGVIAATSTDGVTWTQRTLPASEDWLSVTYGNGTFVAVANARSIAATSTDGISWTQRTLPTTAYWRSVTYGNGTFVAVAISSNIAATSPDGIIWTQRTLPASANWFGVTYGNGTFVAVANGNNAATSPDGISWTQRTLPASANWFGVTYGNGTFVAVANGNNIAATSPDGISWTQRTLPATASYWHSVTYGDGTFVAVAQLANIAATSTDGVAWTQRTLPATAYWIGVTYGSGTFVAVAGGGSHSNIAATSESTLQFLPLSGETASTLNLTGLTTADDGERYRVVVDSPSVEPVTSDAATLSVPVELAITSQPQNTTASGGEASFAVAATVSDGSTLTYQWEEETLAGGGETWVQRTLPASASWRSVTYGNGTFVAVAYNSNIAATSPDGINWTQRTLPASTVWDSVAYGSGTFVAVSGATNSVSSNIAATSTDGVTWTQQTLPASAYWSSVTYGNGTFVAVESGGGFATSPDGINWTQGTLFYSGLSDVAYGNGTFVAVRQAGANEIAHVSTNGVNWTQVTLPASAYWSSVTYGNGTFVAVADGLKNIAATSPDGVTWTQQSLPAAAYWGSVTYGNGTFVALSRLGGSIPIDRAIAATSPDGINWTPRTLPRLNWSSVTYGDGTFVAVESGSNIAATSESTLQFLPLSGETTPTLNLTGLTTADDGERYRVVVDSPSVEPVTSDAATLATPQVVSFTAQPQNTTAIGGNATFTALAEMSDGTAVTYQWQELIGGNWTDIAGETSQNLALTGLVASDDGEQYRVVADGDRADPVTSNAATLTTPQVVSFTTQPQNTTAAGGNATFTSLAEMSDGTAVTYQWQELIGGNWTDMAGETSQNLALTGLLTSDDGEQYRVVADGDRADPVTSNVATLSVDFTAIAGAAYAAGWNYFGQLGRGDFENVELLDLIDGTSSTNRPEGGQLYTSGWDLYGQRGDS